MDKNEIRTLTRDEFPPLLAEIDDPPKQLFLKGSLPPEDHWLVCVVGSRKASSYGKRAVEHIVSGLAGLPVTIVSGLALGIDAHAHRAALNADLHTIAVPGSGLDPSALYPRSNHGLARDILSAGGGSMGSPQGALLSEYEPTFRATQWSFPKRNRIMAGLSHVVCIIEASERSGTLITARLGLEYSREVMALPGSIFSEGSTGTHQLIRDGAAPLTSADDIRAVLGMDIDTGGDRRADLSGLTENERVLYEQLSEPLSRDELIRASGLNTASANIALTQMELKGLIKEEGGSLWRV